MQFVRVVKKPPLYAEIWDRSDMLEELANFPYASSRVRSAS